MLCFKLFHGAFVPKDCGSIVSVLVHVMPVVWCSSLALVPSVCAGLSTSSRNSPASSVSPGRANDSKLKELPRGRSPATPLPWITVHNLTKDKIDSTPVSLKKLDQVGKHNSYVSDDINVVLEDIPQPSAAPVVSAALTSAGNESTWQGGVW